MTSDLIDQLKGDLDAGSLDGEVSDELIAILRGDPDVKKDWSSVRFGDAVEVLDGDRGSNYPSEGEFFEQGYCLFLSAKNVLNGRFSFEQKNFVTEEKDKALRKGKLSRGDFVLTTRGTVGNYARFDEIINYDNIRINSGMVILRPKSQFLDRLYFHYLLGSSTFRSSMETYSSGSAQPQLPIRDLSSIEIDIPPLHIQKQIADLLSVFDKKIDLLRAQNKTLESIAQTIYKRWFVDFEFPMSKEDAQALNKPELAGQPYKSSGCKMKPSELGKIPEQFSVEPFTLLIDLIISGDWGKESPEEEYTEQVICLRGTDLQDIKYSAKFRAPTRYVKSTKLSSGEVLSGDLVVEISGGTEGQSTGRISYVNKEFLNRINRKLIVSNFCKLVRPNDPTIYSFFYFAWQHLYNRGQFFNFENGTTGIKNLNLKAFINVPILSVNTEYVSMFCEFVNVQLERIQKNLEIMNLNIQAQNLIKKKMI